MTLPLPVAPALMAPAPGGQSSLAPFLLQLGLIVAIFYFLLIRPQQQRQKEMRAMLAALKRGDRVVTGGGILGTVQKVPPADSKSQEIEVEIASNLRVSVLRDTITSVIRPGAANDAKG